MNETKETFGKVSIVMPSYNTARFIAESIDSVRAQTYTDWELLIVDDCSTDDTDAVVAQYADDTRIVYRKNEQNSGAAVSRNTALTLASGEWVAFLDSDDCWEPDKLEKQLRFMTEQHAVFSYTAYAETDEQGVPNGTVVSGPKVISKAGMYAYCWPGCLTVMYNRQAVGAVQITPIAKNNDYAMWLQVCQKASCHLLPQVLARYRLRSGSISRHGYAKLIKWHYRLWRGPQRKTAVSAAVMTAVNLVCGLYKKLVYKTAKG